ncbi:hypothetical protein G6M87_00475 [Rhizobium rhizogenes]|uniref:hypothetical protein n=1 Tax=Rhizobium rhizogenes TaxID=359 RepID=UPI00157374E7|nr:hypothetical protein [Rhizobium rhizogenes]NTI24196.1 hypothetical protein [Rhizobium rhizogenes]QTG04023.1 hypothetical protein G6M87_00475 [Rhizobium rhizogenes]
MLSDFEEQFRAFYNGIDEYVSSNVRPGRIGHGETACTANLLMCLDAAAPPDFLPFNAQTFCDELSAALRESDIEEGFQFTLNAHGFNQNHEGAITQSDYAIRLTRRDNRENNKTKPSSSVYFFQAKIMRPDDSFGIDTEQDVKINILRQFIGHKHLSYVLYRPLQRGGMRLTIDPRQTPGESWVDFMTEWATGSIEDEGEPDSKPYQLRNALLDNNPRANDYIARQLGTDSRRWTTYKPAIIEIGLEYPVYKPKYKPVHTPAFSGGMMGGSATDTTEEDE